MPIIFYLYLTNYLLRFKQVRIHGNLHALQFYEYWTFTTMDSRDENMMSRVVQLDVGIRPDALSGEE